MDYKKEDLIKHSIKRLDTIDEVLEDCQLNLNAINTEKHVVRYLLWLGFERKNEESK